MVPLGFTPGVAVLGVALGASVSTVPGAVPALPSTSDSSVPTRSEASSGLAVFVGLDVGVLELEVSSSLVVAS
jgi:hypothetical protein